MTRGMLLAGVIAGPLYLVAGLALALTRPGFDLSRHQLSLLMLGDLGWAQRANLAIAGVLTVIAAIGWLRATSRGSGRGAGVLVLIYGLALVGSAIAAPDPMLGFPAGAAEQATISGLLHIVFGALGFVALAISGFWLGRALLRAGRRAAGRFGIVAGVVILAGFVAGAALSQSPFGVLLLWIAVIASFAWLAVGSLALRTDPVRVP